MADGVTIWTNPRCSKSRGAEALLAELGVPVERVLYLDTPPSRVDIERVLRLLGTDDPRRSSAPASRPTPSWGWPTPTASSCSTP